MNLPELARRLHALGHAPEFEKVDVEFFEWVLADGGQELITRYQEFHKLAETGESNPETIAHAKLHRCGHPDRMAVTAGESAWSIPLIRYFQTIVYPGVDPAEIAADYAQAIASMAEVCGIAIAPAPDANSAQILATSGPIDGQWNVLALTELPPPGAGAGTVLNQKFDSSEIGLSRAQRIAMMAHEAGHFLGLGHAAPGTGALMEPVLSAITSPQAWDTAQLQERYGPDRTPLTPTPTPPIGPTPPAGPPPAVKPGPPVDCVQFNIGSPGSYQYNFNFDSAGRYLVLIVPI